MNFTKKKFILLAIVLMVFAGILFQGCRKEQRTLYTIGIFQVNNAPHLNEVRKAFIRALEDGGLNSAKNMNLIVKNAQGDIPEAQRIAEELVAQKVNLIVALSTPCLQAALHATREIPIVFSSVANPYLAGAGKSAEDHLSNVTGVSSRGPIKEGLAFFKEILPQARRAGTLWTPSEINSEYYLELVREGAAELGLEIIDVPIANSSEVLLAAQVLVNKKIDAIFQISDNTINASFEALGRIAEENALPLFGGFLLSTRLGACAAMGWDFSDMGYKAGQIALRVKNGENPAAIPIQYMSETHLYLNLDAAEKQGVKFSEDILARADKTFGSEQSSSSSVRIR